jgi:hypothetical protein
MQLDRPATRAAAIFAVATGSLLVSACGSTPGAASPTARNKPATTTTTLDSTAAAVLAAYRAGWAAFEHALSDANPEDPALAATMIAPQLTGVRANLVADQQQGIVGRGTFTLHPKIASLAATTATVVDCAYSTSVLVYAKSGKPVPPITPPENDGVQATVVLTGGTWKVSKQTVTDGKCAPNP